MLPSYTKQYDDQVPLLPTTDYGQGRESIETAPPTYPPSSSGSGARSNVQYIYRPEYPRKGDDKTAVGVLGRTKSETIQIVQKGFPELAEFDEERITFLNSDDAIIFDEAWEHFVSSPPEKLKIKVADAPGEWDKRQRRIQRQGCVECASILGGIFLFLGAIAVFIIILASLKK